MVFSEEITHLKQNLKFRIKASTDQDLMKCYQCGKCSAGCPLIDEMDIAPNQIIRMLQTEFQNLEERVLNSYSIWLCLSCQQCYTRCPQNINLPEIMDFLRQESIKRNLINEKAKDIVKFYKAFLDTIYRYGRLSELNMIVGYKFNTFHLFKDLDIAPKMFINGKLKILPTKIQNVDVIKKIFREYRNKEAN